jgi:hypothetical protein
MTRFTRTTIKGALAASAAAALLVAIPMAPAQADGHVVNPVGNWKLTGLQIGDAPVVPCPTPTTEFSERWFCEDNTFLRLRKNGNYRDNIPIIQTNRGTWFSNGKNIIVFDDADDDGSDARAYGMAITGKKGQNMKVSLRSTGRGPNEETLELHMIFKKQ